MLLMSTTLSPLGQAALAYAAKGFAVFPCKPRSKHPLTERGFLDATFNTGQITEWWRSMPTANVGLSCIASGLVVLDIDPRNGGNEILAALLAELGQLPATAEAASGGGGRHLIFHAPPGKMRGSLGPGLDIKHDGYIIVPPSVHPSGGAYRWVEPL
jgi:hypothetical protein